MVDVHIRAVLGRQQLSDRQGLEQMERQSGHRQFRRNDYSGLAGAVSGSDHLPRSQSQQGLVRFHGGLPQTGRRRVSRMSATKIIILSVSMLCYNLIDVYLLKPAWIHLCKYLICK